MPNITPFLWFDNNLEEAVNHYASIFKDAKILNIARAEGRVLTITFELNGQRFVGLNGGPHFKFTEAVSFMVSCDTQEEVDRYWEKLSEGGLQGQCGWLKDKFGLSWQIVPKVLGELLSDQDPQKSRAVMQSMLKMKKIVIADLQKAREGNVAA